MNNKESTGSGINVEPTTQPEKPITTYFDPVIDWQAREQNPFRAAVEGQREAITNKPTFFNKWGNV